MIRVLHIFHEMANGGIEAFVMNNYRRLDRNQIQFDFLTSVDRVGYFDEEIEALGGKIYHVYPLKKNPIKNYYDIARIVRENNYQIVHRHTGSAFGYYDLRAARSGGAEYLILHSHNPKAGNSLIHKVSNAILRFDCEKVACSTDAGKFLFGEKAEFRIIVNAIECDRFRFSPEIRNKVRYEWNAEDAFVVGHIGRFEDQKNHKKLLEIFKSITERKANSLLVCIGSGSLLENTKAYARKLGIFDKIRFLGTRNDVNDLINGFDVFCFPSKYEGFSITQIEVQVNGLSVITSKGVVPAESNIAGNVHFVPLEYDNRKWADEVLSVPQERDLSAITRIKNAGYDLVVSAERLTDYYKSLLDGEKAKRER